MKTNSPVSAFTAPVLAFDWGGTNLRVAIVDHGGNILWKTRQDTFPEENHLAMENLPPGEAERYREDTTQQRFRDAISEGRSRLLDEYHVPEVRVGGSSAGPLDPMLAILHSPVNIGCGEFQLDDIVVRNDLEAIGIGHYAYGEGQGESHLGVIAPGTGLGVAYLEDGRPHWGGRRSGHIALEGGLTYYPGLTLDEMTAALKNDEFQSLGHPTYEDFTAKGFWNLYAYVHGPSNAADGTIRSAPRKERAVLIEKFAREGDDVCRTVCERVARHHGSYAAMFQHHMNPDTIVIDGSCKHIFLDGDFGEAMWDAFREEYLARTLPVYHGTEFRVGLLDDAGLKGAAYVARNEWHS